MFPSRHHLSKGLRSLGPRADGRRWERLGLIYFTSKRGIAGTYHHVSQQHLRHYLAEFDFRYNNRAKLGIEDKARGDALIRGIVAERLTYTDSSEGRA
jgi:hypothetical protein